jgi:hypothetical protein
MHEPEAEESPMLLPSVRSLGSSLPRPSAALILAAAGLALLAAPAVPITLPTGSTPAARTGSPS